MDSATISDSTSFAVPVSKARMKEEFRSILVSISPVKNRLPSGPLQHVHGFRIQLLLVCGRFEELLGIERLIPKHIKRLEWEVQQEKIRRWIHGAKICIRGLFAGERTLTKQIFNGLGTTISDDCFMKTIKDSAIQFFIFVEAISGGRRSPEKLFKILDLCQVLTDLLPDIHTVFNSKPGEFIRKRAVEILSSLSEAARGILSEFEKAVFGEISKVRILEGSVHPLTKYVMNYIHDMVKHKQTLTQLIVSNPSSSDYICSSNLDFDFSEF